MFASPHLLEMSIIQARFPTREAYPFSLDEDMESPHER